jgi:DNA-binding IclR family transcriptional regulator
MARPAPSIERTVAILNFLADHPDQRFSVSELCRRVGVPKATAHAHLHTLADAGYLVRHPVEKTFTLGPALVSLGIAAAATQHGIVDLARDEMHRIGDELRAQCVASTAMGGEIVLLATAGRAQAIGLSANVGARVPLVPPLGTVFMAWAEPAEVDAWVRRLGRNPDDVELERYRGALGAVRRRGYALGLDAAAMARVTQALREHDDPHRYILELGHAEYVLTDLEPDASHRVFLLAAPVFGADGNVALALTVFGFETPVAADAVPRHAERLLHATRQVTAAIGGRPPDDSLTHVDAVAMGDARNPRA